MPYGHFLVVFGFVGLFGMHLPMLPVSICGRSSAGFVAAYSVSSVRRRSAFGVEVVTGTLGSDVGSHSLPADIVIVIIEVGSTRAVARHLSGGISSATTAVSIPFLYSFGSNSDGPFLPLDVVDRASITTSCQNLRHLIAIGLGHALVFWSLDDVVSGLGRMEDLVRAKKGNYSEGSGSAILAVTAL
jgi:hypothetical protein